jgi:glycosyltransferase involved in cell wall biosynthesis
MAYRQSGPQQAFGEEHARVDVEVLQVISSTNRRGAEVAAVDLEAGLRSLGRRIATVALAAGSQERALAVSTLGRRQLAATTLLALRRRMQTAAITVAHGSRSLPACALSSVGTRTRWIYRSIGDPTYWAATGPRRTRVARALKQASGVVTTWRGAADALVRLHGVPESRIWVIPTGVPATRVRTVRPEARPARKERFGLDPQTPVIAFIGALSDEKNPAAAVRSMRGLHDVHLIVAGDGPQRTALVHLAHQEARGRVHFLGAISDVSSALELADALVIPSRTEGLPAVAIEAGMAALPVVATNVGGISEVVVDGETGFIVPDDGESLAEALRECLSTDAPLGDRARARCMKMFEIGVVASAWNELVQRQLEGRSAPA